MAYNFYKFIEIFGKIYGIFWKKFTIFLKIKSGIKCPENIGWIWKKSAENPSKYLEKISKILRILEKFINNVFLYSKSLLEI